jgi:hypothetical protein
MIQLETYRGTKSRHVCPACNSKGVFVRYVGERGEYISSDVGRCNRESKCGYHKKPQQYFAEKGIFGQGFKPKRRLKPIYKAQVLTEKPKPFDFIAPEYLTATLGNYDQNSFVQFLLNLFPDCRDEIQAVLKMYLVGTFDDYTCFPYLDRLNRICRAKLIRFNRANGKRLKGDFDTSSLVRKLGLKEDFNYKQVFFGEHLLSKYPDKPVAIVESEKTAIIAGLCLPQFVWLGSNSKSWLKVERLQRLGTRQIILYPDADGFDQWQSVASDATRQGSTIKVSSLIERHATDQEKASGYDLADYLINQQAEINQTNNFIDSYNAKLETVLNDESLRSDFETILDEQLAIAIYNGLSDARADALLTRPENLRRIILNTYAGV